MKRSVLISTYCGLLTIALFLYSCEKEDFTPYTHVNNGTAKMDSSGVFDSTGGFNFDFTPHGNSGVWNDSLGGGTNPGDSTGGNTGGGWTPNDSLWFNGGNPHGNGPIWNDSIGGGTNPGDTLGGGN